MFVQILLIFSLKCITIITSITNMVTTIFDGIYVEYLSFERIILRSFNCSEMRLNWTLHFLFLFTSLLLLLNELYVIAAIRVI